MQRAGETFSVARAGTYLLRSWGAGWDEEASQLHPHASLKGRISKKNVKMENAKEGGGRQKERREQSTVQDGSTRIEEGLVGTQTRRRRPLEQVEGSGMVHIAANLKVPKWV